MDLSCEQREVLDHCALPLVLHFVDPSDQFERPLRAVLSVVFDLPPDLTMSEQLVLLLGSHWSAARYLAQQVVAWANCQDEIARCVLLQCQDISWWASFIAQILQWVSEPGAGALPETYHLDQLNHRFGLVDEVYAAGFFDIKDDRKAHKDPSEKDPSLAHLFDEIHSLVWRAHKNGNTGKNLPSR